MQFRSKGDDRMKYSKIQLPCFRLRLSPGKLFFLVFLLALGSGCGKKEPVLLAEEEALSEEASGLEDGEAYLGQEEQAPSGEELAAGTIWVDICGAVAAPGVYEMTEGDRLYQLIEKAGGFTSQAEQMSVNQARVLVDGEQIRIYTREEYEQGEASIENTKEPEGGSQREASGKVNLNLATVEELTTLDGIGPSKAAAIVAYRKEHGAFTSIEEIMQVGGIGEATFEKMKAYIAVS